MTTVAASAAVRRISDLVYARHDGVDLLADLILPEDAPGPLPVILWLHGGGWRFGDRNLAPDLSRFFAAEGFAMATIEYRLTDVAIFPAQIHDVRAAIRWLRSIAPDYGLDPARIGVWGSSAGGHLAALAGLAGESELDPPARAHDGFSARVQAVVDGYGPIDFLQIDANRLPPAAAGDDPESSRLPPDMKSAPADSFESRLIGAPIETRPDLVAAANPVTYAKSGAPPFLILHGTSDTAMPHHQSEILFEALARTGNEATLVLIDRTGHGFLNRPEGWGAGRATTLKRCKGGVVEGPMPGPEAGYRLIGDFFRRTLG